MTVQHTLVSLLLLTSPLMTGAALAQNAQTEPAPEQSSIVYSTPIADGPRQSALIRSETNTPTTITWGQSATVPNAADYRVRLADLDANGDGVLTRDEVPATHALSSEFKLVDANRDGRISEEELQNWR